MDGKNYLLEKLRNEDYDKMADEEVHLVYRCKACGEIFIKKYNLRYILKSSTGLAYSRINLNHECKGINDFLKFNDPDKTPKKILGFVPLFEPVGILKIDETEEDVEENEDK